MKATKHFTTVAIAILIFGSIGGVGKYIRIESLDVDPLKGFFLGDSIWSALILGCIAAGMLPVLLKVISSDLLKIQDDVFDKNNYLLFASLCLIAGYNSDKILKGSYSAGLPGLEEKLSQSISDLQQNMRKSNELTFDLVSTLVKDQSDSEDIELVKEQLSEIRNSYMDELTDENEEFTDIPDE